MTLPNTLLCHPSNSHIAVATAKDLACGVSIQATAGKEARPAAQAHFMGAWKSMDSPIRTSWSNSITLHGCDSFSRLRRHGTDDEQLAQAAYRT